MIEIRPVEGIPEVYEGAPLGVMIATACEPRDDDVVVISQKIVSKAEGRVRDLATVEPSDRAEELAAELGKNPRLVELILAESREVLRAEHGVLIVETHGGLVCANAGIDSSNVPGDGHGRAPPRGRRRVRQADPRRDREGRRDPARGRDRRQLRPARGASARPRWRSAARAFARSTTGAA